MGTRCYKVFVKFTFNNIFRPFTFSEQEIFKSVGAVVKSSGSQNDYEKTQAIKTPLPFSLGWKFQNNEDQLNSNKNLLLPKKGELKTTTVVLTNALVSCEIFNIFCPFCTADLGRNIINMHIQNTEYYQLNDLMGFSQRLKKRKYTTLSIKHSAVNHTEINKVNAISKSFVLQKQKYWKCLVCLVDRNPLTATSCEACETPRNLSNETSPKTLPLFKDPISKESSANRVLEMENTTLNKPSILSKPLTVDQNILGHAKLSNKWTKEQKQISKSGTALLNLSTAKSAISNITGINDKPNSTTMFGSSDRKQGVQNPFTTTSKNATRAANNPFSNTTDMLSLNASHGPTNPFMKNSEPQKDVFSNQTDNKRVGETTKILTRDATNPFMSFAEGVKVPSEHAFRESQMKTSFSIGLSAPKQTSKRKIRRIKRKL